MTLGPEPPHPGNGVARNASPSIPIERALIGCVLVKPSVFARVSGLVSTLDFSTIAHREIWRAICVVVMRAEEPDAITVNAELRARNVPAGGTDFEALTSFGDEVATTVLVEQHAKAVREAGQRRRLAELAATVAETARRPDTDFGELVAQVREALDALDGLGKAPASAGAAKALPILALAEIPDPGPTRWLVEGLWTDGAFGILGALPKSWKSFFTLQLAISLSTGAPLFNRFAVHRRGRTLIFGAEGGPASIRRRMGAMCRALGVDLAELEVDVIDVPMMHLDRPEVMARFVATVEAAKPALVVLDPLRELHTGDENDSAYIASLLGPLRSLQARVGCAVLVVHHNIKPPAQEKSKRRPAEQLRGTGALSGAMDSGVFLEDNGKRSTEKRVSVSAMHRDAQEPDDFVLKLQLIAHDDGPALCLELDEQDSRDDVVKALDSRDAGMRKVLRTIVQSCIPGRERITSIRALAKATGMAQRTARDALQSLIEAKQVEHAEQGYAVTAAGKERECEQRA